MPLFLLFLIKTIYLSIYGQCIGVLQLYVSYSNVIFFIMAILFNAMRLKRKCRK